MNTSMTGFGFTPKARRLPHRMRAGRPCAHQPVASKAYRTLWYYPPGYKIDKEYIDHFDTSQSLESDRWSTSDFDFRKPPARLGVESILGRERAHKALARYEWPGDYSELEAGEEFARIRMQEIYARSKRAHGSGRVRDVECGTTFELQGYPQDRANQEYLVISARFTATEVGEATGGNEFSIHTEFEVQPATIVYRAPRTIEKPRTTGPQTAIVTGPENCEIWTDKYGRVKVKFHWDRSEVKDQRSSCWVRVAYPWAGSQFGTISIPRVGQEVIVDFENGDPDRPIIIGRVYNGSRMPPWELPGNATQSGVLTRSTQGGNYETANAIRFEDKKGSEELWVHAEKDMRTEVEHDASLDIGNDSKVSIGDDQRIGIGKNQMESIGLTEIQNVGVLKMTNVGGISSENVGLVKNVLVGVEYAEEVGVNKNVLVGMSHTERTLGERSITVDKEMTLTVGKKLTLNAGESLELVCGQTRIVLDGKNIQVLAEGDITLGAKGDLNLVGNNSIGHYGNIVVNETVNVYVSYVTNYGYTAPKKGPSWDQGWRTSLIQMGFITVGDLLSGQKLGYSLVGGAIGGALASNGIGAVALDQELPVDMAADAMPWINAVASIGSKTLQGGVTNVATGKGSFGAGAGSALPAAVSAAGTTAAAPAANTGANAGSQPGSTGTDANNVGAAPVPNSNSTASSASAAAVGSTDSAATSAPLQPTTDK